MKRTVTIVYKSGAKVTLRVKEFTVNRKGGAIESVEWNSAKPRPLHIGVDDIAAVYEGQA